MNRKWTVFFLCLLSLQTMYGSLAFRIEHSEVEEDDEGFCVIWDEEEYRSKVEEMSIFGWALYWKEKNGEAPSLTYRTFRNEENGVTTQHVLLEASSGCSYVPAWKKTLGDKSPSFVVKSTHNDLELLCGHINGALEGNPEDMQELTEWWGMSSDDPLTLQSLAKHKKKMSGEFLEYLYFLSGELEKGWSRELSVF